MVGSLPSRALARDACVRGGCTGAAMARHGTRMQTAIVHRGIRMIALVWLWLNGPAPL